MTFTKFNLKLNEFSIRRQDIGKQGNKILFPVLLMKINRFATPKFFQKAAFSLIEMLMALLVASLLMAAIAPVVTKKVEQRMSIDATITTTPGEIGQPGGKCYTSNASNVPVNIERKQIGFLRAVIVSGGGGGGSASPGSLSTNITYNNNVPQATDGNNVEQTIPINKNMKNFKLKFMTGGGGGGGGGAEYTYTLSPSAENCRNYGVDEGLTDTSGHTATPTTPIAVYSSGANVCVTAYAQHPDFSTSADNYTTSGDDRIGPQNATYVTDICHKYTSFNSANTISDPKDYYVCTYTAAVTACDRLRTKTGKPWRIPTQTELGNFGYSFASATIPTGMQACNINSGSYQCPLLNSGSNRYYPYSTWSSGSGTSSNCYTDSGGTPGPRQYTRVLNSTSSWDQNTACTYKNTNGNIYYFSVRCVLSFWEPLKFNSFSGGGGGSSPSIANNSTINSHINVAVQKVIDSGTPGSIVLTAGHGGDGGNRGGTGTSGTRAGNGSNGESSCLVVKKGSDEIYKVCVFGGNGGKGAVPAASITEPSDGWPQGGAEISIANGCKEYIDGALTSTGCTSKGLKGENGNATQSTSAAAHGIGALSTYSNASTTGAGYNTTTGAGSTLTNETNPGAGGGAGRAISKTVAGQGGRGSGGRIELVYDEQTPGGNGGGGAAGNLVHIDRIYNYANSTFTCNVTVGQGGGGGEVAASNGNRGADGGFSMLECNIPGTTMNLSFKVEGGEGGGAGTNAANSSSNPSYGAGGAARASVTGPNAVLLSLPNYNVKFTKLGKKGENGSTEKGGAGGTILDGTIPYSGGLVYSALLETLWSEAFGWNNVFPIFPSPVYEEFRKASPTYPVAGLGGGGGSYSSTTTDTHFGNGGAGSPGYVCIYWIGG